MEQHDDNHHLAERQAACRKPLGGFIVRQQTAFAVALKGRAKVIGIAIDFYKQRETGVGPATSTLARSRSTTELFPQ